MTKSVERTTSRFSDPDGVSNIQRLTAYLDFVSQVPEIRRARSVMSDRLAPQAGMTVLDVGCGLGDTTAEIALKLAAGGHAIGIDLSERFLEVATVRHGHIPGLDFRPGDVNNLAFPSDSIDRVRSERLLQHVQEADAAIVEITRVLKPGGLALFLEPDWGSLAIDHPDSTATATIIAAFRRAFMQARIGLHLPRLCNQAGLKVLEVEVFGASGRTYEQIDGLLNFNRMVEIADGYDPSEVDGLRWISQMRSSEPFAYVNLVFVLAEKRT